MDLLISLTILLAVLVAAAIFLGITRRRSSASPSPGPSMTDSVDSPRSPAVPSTAVFMPTLLYLLTLVFLALLTPLAILFSTAKLPTLIPLFAFMTLPVLAYAYLWRFNHVMPPPPEKLKR